MLKRVQNPDAKLLSDLSEVVRANSALAKYTADDRGDLKLYRTGDGKRTFLRVCETILPTGTAKEGGAAQYAFHLYEVVEPTGALASPAPTILDRK